MEISTSKGAAAFLKISTSKEAAALIGAASDQLQFTYMELDEINFIWTVYLFGI